MDTLLSMRVFSKVVETENFSEAARRLKLSPPMVTRHIRNLEQRLGARLINRTTHHFSLTEAGASYFERCSRLLADIEEAEETIGSLNRSPRGRLRLTAPMDFGRVEIWPMVRDFMRRYPDIQVDLVMTNRVVDLVEEEIDVAVRMSDSPLDGSFIVRKLALSRQVVCAAPEYLRKHGTPKVPGDLLAHRCLVYGTTGRHDGWEFSRNGKTERIKVPGYLQSNQIRLLSEAAIDGTGIAMLPTFCVWRYLAEGKLRTVLDGWSGGNIGVFVLYPSRSFLPAKTRAFIDFLADRFPGGPARDPWGDRAQQKFRPRVRREIGNGSSAARPSASARARAA